MNVSPSLLSRQPSLSCCASWAQAELALYQSMLLILQRFVKNRTFDINRPLARIKSPVFCGTFYTSHDPNAPTCTGYAIQRYSGM